MWIENLSSLGVFGEISIILVISLERVIIFANRWSIHPSFLKYITCHYLQISHFNLFDFMHADSFCRFGLEAIGENAILLWSWSTDCESLSMCQSKQGCFSFFIVNFEHEDHLDFKACKIIKILTPICWRVSK